MSENDVDLEGSVEWDVKKAGVGGATISNRDEPGKSQALGFKITFPGSRGSGVLFDYTLTAIRFHFDNFFTISFSNSYVSFHFSLPFRLTLFLS